MTFQRRREDAADGSYHMFAWDDAVGLAKIWKYDLEGRLTALGVVTHWPREHWDGEITGEAVWYDAEGRETRRSQVRTTTEGSPGG